MASSASTWTWSWNTTPDSSFRLSTFCNPSTSASTPSSSSCSSSSSSSSSFQRKSRRTHVTHFSLDSSPPASSSDRSRKRTNNESIRNPTSDSSARNRSRKSSTQIGRLADGSFVLVESDEKEPNGFRPILRLRRLRRACLKLLFGKKPLWKGIFFASKKVRSIILLNVLTVIYASDIPVIKEVEEIMNPALFTFVRFAVFSIPFLPFILRARGDGQTRAAGIELGFWVSLGYLAQALGMLTSDAGRASFISAFTVVVVPLIDGMFGATVPAHTWFGALMSLMGVMMLESSGSPPSVGDILNISSAVFFGIHMLRTEHFSRIMKKESLLPLLGYEVVVPTNHKAFAYSLTFIETDSLIWPSANPSNIWKSEQSIGCCLYRFPGSEDRAHLSFAGLKCSKQINRDMKELKVPFCFTYCRRPGLL